MQYNPGNDWKNLGEDVKNTVQNAIASGNYSNLSSDISRIANEAFGSLGNTISGSVNSGNPYNKDAGQDTSEAQFYKNSNTMRDNYGRNNRREYQPDPNWQNTKTYQYIKNINEDHASDRTVRQHYQNPDAGKPVLYESTSVKKALAVTGAIVGYTIGSGFAIAELILMIFLHVASAVLIPMGIMFPLMAAAFAGGIAGSSSYSSIKRFERYIAGLGGKTYADVKALAAAAGKSEGYTVKDLKKFIKKGWFRQGHLDNTEKCLITSDDMFQQYIAAEKQQEIVQKSREEEDREMSKLSSEAKEMLAAGDEYIKQIHECNDEIPGEEMSGKISHTENSVRNIFNRAKEHPEAIGDLRRMMSYYLPTTVKLLKAYADMDRQEIKGDNIEKSKKEIEDTIDTLNAAFDKLFDSMFEDTSLDVSTDATVMKNLLAQEGLTGHDFDSEIKLQ